MIAVPFLESFTWWCSYFFDNFTCFAHSKSLKYHKMMVQVHGDVANGLLWPSSRCFWGSSRCKVEGGHKLKHILIMCKSLKYLVRVLTAGFSLSLCCDNNQPPFPSKVSWTSTWLHLWLKPVQATGYGQAFMLCGVSSCSLFQLSQSEDSPCPVAWSEGHCYNSNSLFFPLGCAHEALGAV